MVAGCTFLGQVAGTSNAVSFTAAKAVGRAKNDAIAQAARKGATHIVWGSMAAQRPATAAARAYVCPGSPDKTK